MRKKIVFVIVEGPSDQTALGSVLSHIFPDELVHVHVVGGDITTQTTERSDIVQKVSDLIRAEAGIYHWRASDVAQVIHVVDMDGAFVPEDKIILDTMRKHIRYHEREIRTPDRTSILERNRRKKINLNRLIRIHEVWQKVPYGVYYMSCNLDHVLYGQLNLPDKDKMEMAYRFALRYREDSAAFYEFMADSSFSVDGTYKETWDYIKVDCRSLERHSNLHLALEEKE